MVAGNFAYSAYLASCAYCAMFVVLTPPLACGKNAILITYEMCAVVAQSLLAVCFAHTLENLFARRHHKHRLPCTDQQPAESLASTHSAFARRTFRLTNYRINVQCVVGAGQNARDSLCACCAQFVSTLPQAHRHSHTRRPTNAPEMVS